MKLLLRNTTGAMLSVATNLCDVSVDLAVVRRAGEVLPLNEPFDALLDNHWRRQEARAQLFRHFGYQERVLQYTQTLTNKFNCSDQA